MHLGSSPHKPSYHEQRSINFVVYRYFVDYFDINGYALLDALFLIKRLPSIAEIVSKMFILPHTARKVPPMTEISN